MTFQQTIRRLTAALAITFLMFNGQCEPGPPPDPDAGAYHTFREVDSELHDLATRFPALASIRKIGTSLEQRDIWALKISDRVTEDEGEQRVVFVGAHHAREWISVEVPMLLAVRLLESYGSDTLITRLVDNAEIWVIPMLNPDGHQYSVLSNRLWRKNRRNNGDGTFGVDLNRNYGHEWGGPGSSGDTFSEIYRGPSAFSEPESQALRDFLLANRPAGLLSYHNFSQLILYPWGHTNAPPPDEAVFQQLTRAMADEVRAVNGKRYTPQQSSDLYLASGDTTDWLFAVMGATALTIELRPAGSNPGFVLPESEIGPTFEENLPAALYFIDWVLQNRPTI